MESVDLAWNFMELSIKQVSGRGSTNRQDSTKNKLQTWIKKSTKTMTPELKPNELKIQPTGRNSNPKKPSNCKCKKRQERISWEKI